MPVYGKKPKRTTPEYLRPARVNPVDIEFWPKMVTPVDIEFSSLYPGWFSGEFINISEEKALEELKKFNECSNLAEFTDWLRNRKI